MLFNIIILSRDQLSAIHWRDLTFFGVPGWSFFLLQKLDRRILCRFSRRQDRYCLYISFWMQNMCYILYVSNRMYVYWQSRGNRQRTNYISADHEILIVRNVRTRIRELALLAFNCDNCNLSNRQKVNIKGLRGTNNTLYAYVKINVCCA